MRHQTIVIDKPQAGRTVADVLCAVLRMSRPQVVKLLRARRVQLDRFPCLAPGRRLRRGQRLLVRLPDLPKKTDSRPTRSRATLDAPPAHPLAQAIRIVHVDADIIVVDKPAGLTTVRHKDEIADFGKRAQRYLPPTLVDLLPGVLPPKERRGRIRAVHRLDKETSGLLVLARTQAAESNLGLQFRKHTVDRTYLALVRGRAQEARIESWLVADRGDGRRGSGPEQEGRRAVTEVVVLEQLGEFTLIECRLESGRTHQVRIHLGEQGTPLCGERVYDRALHAQPTPDQSGAARPLLHAASLAIDHPATGRRLAWRRDLPADMQSVLAKLRRKR